MFLSFFTDFISAKWQQKKKKLSEGSGHLTFKANNISWLTAHCVKCVKIKRWQTGLVNGWLQTQTFNLEMSYIWTAKCHILKVDCSLFIVICCNAQQYTKCFRIISGMCLVKAHGKCLERGDWKVTGQTICESHLSQPIRFVSDSLATSRLPIGVRGNISFMSPPCC